MEFSWKTVFGVALVIAFALIAGFLLPKAANAPSEAPPAILTNAPQSATTSASQASAPPATTTPAKSVTKPGKPAPAPAPAPLPAIVGAITKPLPPASTSTPQSVTDVVRSAVVNILCVTKAGGPLESISGSGIFIDTRGVILTNAHIAQYFLLKDYPTPGFVSCVVRTGSPAYPSYTAKLLFLSPSWMKDNAQKINEQDPTENGAHDYALLLVTGTTGPSVSLPASFPALPVSVAPPTAGESVLLAAYPAGFLGGITIAENLYATSATAAVADLYTFGQDTVDLFSIGGTVVAQKGSSGGAVTDPSGDLLGLIVTATDAANTASRELRALSTAYIVRDFANESGTGLGTLLAGDVATEAKAFELGTEPFLRQELVNAIENP